MRKITWFRKDNEKVKGTAYFECWAGLSEHAYAIVIMENGYAGTLSLKDYYIKFEDIKD